MKQASKAKPKLFHASSNKLRRPLWRGHMKDEHGQAALEYLLVGLVLLAMIVALGALWRFIADDGMSHVLSENSSHTLQQPGGVVDALMF